MNLFQQKTSKALALFLAVGLIAPLAGCEAPGQEDSDDNDQPTEQTVPDQEEGGEGGEDG
jgi:hypothetical protein